MVISHTRDVCDCMIAQPHSLATMDRINYDRQLALDNSLLQHYDYTALAHRQRDHAVTMGKRRCSMEIKE